MSTLIDQLLEIQDRLEDVKIGLVEAREADEEDHSRDEVNHYKDEFIEELRNICAIIRDNERILDPSSDEWNKLLAEAQSIFDDMTHWASDGGEVCPYPYIPAFCDDQDASPMVIDEFDQDAVTALGSGLVDSFLQHFKAIDPTLADRVPRVPLADLSTKPHKLTSKISRFRDYSAPLARAPPAGAKIGMIYQARCETELYDMSRPTGKLCIAEAEGRLATLGACGGKERDPTVSFFDISDSEDITVGSPYFTLGFTGLVRDCLLSGPNRLLVVGDRTERSRIKTMKWSDDNMRLLNMHTFSSGICKGPLAVLGTKLIRAGKGAARVWDLETAPTHGPSGTSRIGRRIGVSETWRDYDDEIEVSTGSRHDTVFRYTDDLNNHYPDIWTHAPSFSAGTLLSSEGNEKKRFSTVYAFDLESTGQVAGRYMGHSDYVTDINMTVGDGNTFITASADGYARIFDKRHPLPVITFDSMQNHPSHAALSITPDGIPLVITDRTESIKVWDVRTRSLVYELATGNNQVVGLAWDDIRSTLYASLDCHWLDRQGKAIDYRKARPSPPQNVKRIRGDGEENGEDSGADAEKNVASPYKGQRWPRKAARPEGYFEETYDAARHGLAVFRFKEEPDPSIFPIDGGSFL